MRIDIIGKECCGCRSCEQSCPKQCIDMVENDEGFIYPKIDNTKCIDCGKCIKNCPIYNYKNKEKTCKVYAFRSKNNNIINSASGGICDLIARKVIEDGGVVYGVAYDSEFNAVFMRTTTIDELYQIQSSKYVFSDTKDSYTKVKTDLKNGLYVLYSGTSCQIDGLISFLGSDHPNLFTISIICHGVPSPKLFKSYIAYNEKKNNKKIIGYNFRSKYKNGWGLTEQIKFSNNTSSFESLPFTSYGNDFLLGLNYRESCYSCKYCNTNRVGDISVGDFWGIYKAHPKFANKQGISTVMVMTNKGEKMIENISGNAYIIESTLNNAMLKQGNLIKPTSRSSIRDTYYKIFNNSDNFFKDRQPSKNIKYYLRKYLPHWMKRIIKRVLR